MTLSNNQIEQMKNKLVEMKNELRDKENELKEMSMQEATGELNSTVDNHMADSATELYERQKDQTLETADQERLSEIEDALQRIEEGTYGVCADTGEDIPFERLQALPYAKRTAIAQEEFEERHNSGLTSEQSYGENMKRLMDHDTVRGKHSLTTRGLEREQDAF